MSKDDDTDVGFSITGWPAVLVPLAVIFGIVYVLSGSECRLHINIGCPAQTVDGGTR